MFEYALFVIGIIFLVKGAGIFVEGSSSLAKKFGVPTLLIGLTIVAFGTSLPEFLVNIFAAVEGTASVAFGNIIGSNISNILLVMGLTAFILPMKLHRSTVWKEIPFSLLAALVLLVIANDFIIDEISVFSLTKVDGLVMLLFFAVFIYYILELARHNRASLEDKKLQVKERKNYMIALMIFCGILGLFLGGQWVVSGAIFIAKQLGLSEFLISATIVAVGTSLPELITSITAALKKDTDLAVGNIVGSNIFNIFWVLGITALIAPVSIPVTINFDIIFLAVITGLLFVFMFIGKKHQLQKWQGALFVIFYVLYIILIVMRG